MQRLLRPWRHGLRSLLRQPGLTLTGVAVLGLLASFGISRVASTNRSFSPVSISSGNSAVIRAVWCN